MLSLEPLDCYGFIWIISYVWSTSWSTGPPTNCLPGQVGIFTPGLRIASDVARGRNVSLDEVGAEEASCLLMTGPEIVDYTTEMLADLVNRFPEVLCGKLSRKLV